MRDRRYGRLVRLVLCGIAVLLVVPRPARAQQLDLSFHEGRVTLVARDVTVQQILDAWAERGKTVVVNAELMGQERVSLELDRVPEAQAIDRILQSAAGYVARRRSGTDGPSDYALILVLADSDSPRAIAAALADGDPSAPAPETSERSPAAPDAPAPAEPSTDNDAEHEDDSAAFSNAATGRSLDAQPFQDQMAPLESAEPGPAEHLASGRPDNARPGTPSPASAVAPSSAAAAGAAPAESVAPGTSVAPPAPEAPGSGVPTDANGRPLPKPKP